MEKTAMYIIQDVWFSNETACTFYCNGRPDKDVRGTDGTACKIYKTRERAIAAGERYLKKMAKDFGCESLGGIYRNANGKQERI